MKNQRNQIFIFFTMMLGILTLIFFINNHLNVSGSNSSDQIYNIAIQQKDGETLISKELFDQRQWVKGMIVGQHRCPRTLLMGSSTVGMHSYESLPAQNFLNAWLTGPTIDDYESISQLLHEANCNPVNIIIGIDPWLFNHSMISDQWKSLMEYHLRYQSKQSKLYTMALMANYRWSQFKDNFSYVITKQSLEQLLSSKTMQNDPPILAKDQIKNICPPEIINNLVSYGSHDFYVREYDGHFETCPQFVLSKPQIDKIAQTYVIRNVHNMAVWRELDMDAFHRLEQLIEILKQRHSNIVIFVPPYHPYTYEVLLNDKIIFNNLKKMDSLLVELSERSGAKYFNLQNPSTVQCRDIDFNDSHHANKNCAIQTMGKLSPALK